MDIYLKKVRGPLGEGCGGLVISDPISFADFVHDISGEILVSLSVFFSLLNVHQDRLLGAGPGAVWAL